MIAKVVELPKLIIEICVRLHRDIGNGLPEWVYRDCLSRELRARTLRFQRDVRCPGWRGSQGAAFDFVIEDSVAIAIRNGFAAASAEREALDAKLEDAGLAMGLIFNFNELDLRKGTWQTVLEARKTEFWY